MDDVFHLGQCEGCLVVDVCAGSRVGWALCAVRWGLAVPGAGNLTGSGLEFCACPALAVVGARVVVGCVAGVARFGAARVLALRAAWLVCRCHDCMVGEAGRGYFWVGKAGLVAVVGENINDDGVASGGSGWRRWKWGVKGGGGLQVENE